MKKLVMTKMPISGKVVLIVTQSTLIFLQNTHSVLLSHVETSTALDLALSCSDRHHLLLLITVSYTYFSVTVYKYFVYMKCVYCSVLDSILISSIQAVDLRWKPKILFL